MFVHRIQPRWGRPAKAHLATGPGASTRTLVPRSQAEEILRELAYVYKLSASLRQAIEEEQTPAHARVSLN